MEAEAAPSATCLAAHTAGAGTGTGTGSASGINVYRHSDDLTDAGVDNFMKDAKDKYMAADGTVKGFTAMSKELAKQSNADKYFEYVYPGDDIRKMKTMSPDEFRSSNYGYGIDECYKPENDNRTGSPDHFITIFMITILLVSCNNNKISFSIITDSDFDYKKRDLSIKYLKDNCLVAKRGRNIISKFYTQYGNILRIDSITDDIIKLHYELNLKAEQLEIARKNSGVMWIQFVNERFEMVLIYPEDLKSDGGNSFKLIDMYQSNNFIKLTYDYIEEIGIPNLGKGTVVFSFKKNEFGKFELEDYEYDVKGYFIQVENGQLIPSEKGDIVIAQNTTRDILLNNFTLDTENIYGGFN